MTTEGKAPLVQVIVNGSYASKREVIEAIGDVMVASAAVTTSYVEGMLRKEEQGSTVVTAEVALPHGTHDVRDAVLRNAVVVVPIPAGIEWAPGQRVRLAIGFAGTGDQAHLRLLGALARVLSDDETVARLKAATEPRDAAALVNALMS